jgi:hypothetical protein
VEIEEKPAKLRGKRRKKGGEWEFQQIKSQNARKIITI